VVDDVLLLSEFSKMKDKAEVAQEKAKHLDNELASAKKHFQEYEEQTVKVHLQATEKVQTLVEKSIQDGQELLKVIQKNTSLELANNQISLQLQAAVTKFEENAKEMKVLGFIRDQLEEEKNGFLKEMQQTYNLLKEEKAKVLQLEMIKDNQADEFRKRELDLTSVVQQFKNELEDRAQQLKTVSKPEDKRKVIIEEEDDEKKACSPTDNFGKFEVLLGYLKSVRGLLVEIDCNLIGNMILWAVWVVVVFLEIGIFVSKLFATKGRNPTQKRK